MAMQLPSRVNSLYRFDLVKLLKSELASERTLGSSDFLSACMRSCLRASSWCSPILGTTSLPTTTEVMKSRLHSIACRLRADRKQETSSHFYVPVHCQKKKRSKIRKIIGKMDLWYVCSRIAQAKKPVLPSLLYCT